MIGNYLKFMRKKRNLTQEELSQLTGVIRASISQYELETRQPDYATILKIAKACGYEIIFRDVKTKEEITKEQIKREEY